LAPARGEKEGQMRLRPRKRKETYWPRRKKVPGKKKRLHVAIFWEGREGGGPIEREMEKNPAFRIGREGERKKKRSEKKKKGGEGVCNNRGGGGV